jgi:membrane protease subunit (stomatin/prohibitin family)
MRKWMMNFFKGQLANVIEWDEFREDMIFWKWHNVEIKKGSKLVVRPGQDAIFFQQGRIEGIFEEEGDYDVDSQIIPFLSTLKGFRFGFATGMRVEVLFVNTKEFTVKWGTKNAILLPAPGLPGGMPIRANGTFNFKVSDYVALIDNIAGVKRSYLVEDIKIRITSILDQLLMKWISREGKDMFNLQMNGSEIAAGIKQDLDMQVIDLGMTITGFNIMSFNYPKEIQDRIQKSASHSMIGDVGKYQAVEMTDGIASGKVKGGGTASDMAGMMMGMNVAGEMMKKMKESNQEENKPTSQDANQSNNSDGKKPNFCPNCGTKADGANFCSNCGRKLG